MKRYLENGYPDIASIVDYARENNLWFIFMFGGRGTGKTFSVLKYLIEKNYEFMYLRRYQSQADTVMNPKLSPFNKLQSTYDWPLEVKKIDKKVYATSLLNVVDDDIERKMLGLSTGLTSVAGLRGFNADDITALFYDEFIPEAHEKSLKGEAEAFFNAYETINRNRELEGEKPLLAIAAANSNTIINPLMIYLQLVNVVVKMRKSGQKIFRDDKRHILLVDFIDSEISEKKNHTVLYELTAGTAFQAMATGNDFADLDIATESKNIQEYKPIVSIGEICIYKHKSKREYYVTSHKSGAPDTFATDKTSLERFVRKYGYIYNLFVDGFVIFEDRFSEAMFEQYYK